MANGSAPHPRDLESESALVHFLSELQHKAQQGDYVFRGEWEVKGLDGRELSVTSSLYRWVQTNRRHPDHAIPGRLDHVPWPAAETRRLSALQDRIANEINRRLRELHGVVSISLI